MLEEREDVVREGEESESARRGVVVWNEIRLSSGE